MHESVSRRPVLVIAQTNTHGGPVDRAICLNVVIFSDETCERVGLSNRANFDQICSCLHDVKCIRPKTIHYARLL